MPRHSRSRSPRRDHHDRERYHRSSRDRDKDRQQDRDRHRDKDREIDRPNRDRQDRERGRKKTPSPKRQRSKSRTMSPVIRGPSGVKSKNTVNELLLTEQESNQKSNKMTDNLLPTFKNNPPENAEKKKDSGFGNTDGFGNQNGFGETNSRSFGNGGSWAERRGGNRGFGRGSNRNFGRDGEENRSFRGGRGRPNRGDFGRGRGGRFNGPPRRVRDEWEEERERYRHEDKDKPKLVLINPTLVPKGRNYFEHDNRNASPEAESRFARPRRYEDDRRSRRYEDDRRDRERRRDGKMYDPRFDFNSNSKSHRNRGRDGDDPPLGWRNNFNRSENRDRPRRSFVQHRRSPSEEKWVHDKFAEVAREEAKAEKNVELVEKDSHEEEKGGTMVVTTETSGRKIIVE